MSTMDERAQALVAVADAARKGERDAVIAEVIGQGTGLLTQTPGAGGLAKAAFGRAVEASAWGKMRRALASLDAEASETERARKVGGIIADMLREALYEDDRGDPDAALKALEAQIAELNAAVERLAAQKGGIVHHNHVESVSGGSVGIVHGSVRFNNGPKG